MLAAQEPNPAIRAQSCSHSPAWPGGPQSPHLQSRLVGGDPMSSTWPSWGQKACLQPGTCCVAVVICPPRAWGALGAEPTQGSKHLPPALAGL